MIYMKQLFYTMVFSSICFIQAQSQDLIVTAQNDSLNCRIKKVYGGDVYFSIIKNNALSDSILTQPLVKYY